MAQLLTMATTSPSDAVNPVEYGALCGAEPQNVTTGLYRLPA
jgi:hypothetical protein